MEKDFKIKDIKELIDKKGYCIASDKITVDGNKVGYMYREEPDNESDSGWRFFDGTEDREYTTNPENFDIYDLNTICNYDASIIPYLDEEVGSKFTKDENGEFIR